MEQTYDVLVIGGGATGTGVLRDLAMRGIRAALVEQSDLATGTSGRFHGLLHSGCRYVVKDPESARECIVENRILRRIAAHAIDVTSGLFVQLSGDDASYVDAWADGCRQAGIPVQEVGLRAALERDPCLPPTATRVFSVPDGSLDAWRLTQANVRSARARGADVYLWHRVTAIRQENGRVTGVEVFDQVSGQRRQFGCRMLINAAGPWAEQVGRMAGIDIPVALDKGTMVVFNHYLSPRVISRLRPPGDADLLVPVGSVSILGTSAIPIDDPEDRSTDHRVIRRLIAIGSELLPALARLRVLRTYVGVRPLYRPPSAAGSRREISRGAAVMDHEAMHGLAGMVSIVGGKLTTYRAMAEHVTDVVAARLGVTAPCTTHLVPLVEDAAELAGGPDAPAAAPDRSLAEAMNRRRARRLISYLPAAAAAPLVRSGTGPLLCECEGVDAAELLAAARATAHVNLGDLRRRTRLGMGPCQGAACSLRAVGALHQAGLISAAAANRALVDFLDQRWSGVRHSTSLEQLRQIQMTRGMLLGNLNLQDLSAAPAAPAEGGDR